MARTRLPRTRPGQPEVPMLIALYAPAFASSVTVPVHAKYTEYTDWGEDPQVVDAVKSASVDLYNPDTGATFGVDGELLLSDRSGEGTGEVSFDGDPSGSLRTWAIWLLDNNGKPLSAEPQIVDVLFGDDGDGTIVGRATADIVVKNVKIKKRNVSSRLAEDGTHDIQVVVQGSGINAAYVGIQELSTGKAPVVAHADMEAMTAGVYATFQGLVLDALVPLDTWHAQLKGDLVVDGVEFGEDGQPTNTDSLMFDLSFFGAPGKDDATPPLLGTQRLGPIYAIVVKQKRTGNFARPVILDDGDQTFDTWDGTVDFVVEGDVRNAEVAALLTPVGDAIAPVTDILQVLDPSDVAVRGTATGTGKFPASPAEETTRYMSLRPLNKEGKPLDEWRTCTLTPTAKTAVKGSTTLRWVGECLRDSDLGADIRDVAMTMTSTGATTLTAEVLGNEYQSTSSIEFSFATSDLGLASLKGAAAVVETTFSLPYTFKEDAGGGYYTLNVQVYGVSGAVTSELVGTGRYAWDTGSETVQYKDGVSDAVKQAYLEDQKEKKDKK